MDSGLEPAEVPAQNSLSGSGTSTAQVCSEASTSIAVSNDTDSGGMVRTERILYRAAIPPPVVLAILV